MDASTASAAASPAYGLSAGAGAAATQFVGKAFPHPKTDSGDFVGGLAANSAVGGLASVAGGGKFENGAVTAAFGYLYNELGTYRQRGYSRTAMTWLESRHQYRVGGASSVTIDIDTLDFGGLTDDGWSSTGEKVFRFKNTQDFSVHGTVTIQKTDSGRFIVVPERYNNDHKPDMGFFDARNALTAINRVLHGNGNPYQIQFQGSRSFDDLGRKP